MSQPVSEDLALVRNAFLDLIADAVRFDEDVDGDIDSEGRTQISVQHHLTIHDSSLRDLFKALGFQVGYTESTREAVMRAIDESVPIVTVTRWEVTKDNATVWINDENGMCIGRFGRTAIDVHADGEAQIKGEHCLACAPRTDDFEADWHFFVANMLHHHGVTLTDTDRPG